MQNTVALLAESLTYGVALLITLLSGYFVYRQRLTSYQIVRDLAYIASLSLMNLDEVNIVYNDHEFSKTR